MAVEMGKIGQSLLKGAHGNDLEILGPSTAPFAKMRGKFRWQMLVKGKSSYLLHRFARELSSQLDVPLKGKGINLDVDVDPVFIL